MNRAYLGRSTGRRPVGRSKYRWSDAMETCANYLINWREAAQDRKKWRNIVLKAKKTHYITLYIITHYITLLSGP